MSGTTTDTDTSGGYEGKVYLFVQDPKSLLESGYDELRVYRQASKTKPRRELTRAGRTRICIMEGMYNYYYIDFDAEPGFVYEVDLTNSEDDPLYPPLPQGQHQAIDTTFEKVMTVPELQSIYLYGLDGILTNDAGVPFPDAVYAHYIKAAIAKFHEKTDIYLCPTRIDHEKHDYVDHDFRTFMSLQLDAYPVIDIEEITLQFPGADPYTFPKEWIRSFDEAGQVHIVADGSVGTPLVAWARANQRARYGSFIPLVFDVKYFAGFELGKIPANIKDMVGKEAAMGPLNLGGDLVAGAGVANQSISMDGLSTTLGTTCLHPDTGILLASGQQRTIKELANLGGSFMVRTVENGKPIIAKCERAFPTLKKEVWNVRTSLDTLIRCTDDHLFMLRDGSWQRADKLDAETELMSVDGVDFGIRVTSVENTNKVIQLYDLEVPGFECFGVDAGVIVHNSSATNAGFGARLIQYTKENKEAYPDVIRYYKGIRGVVG